MSRPPVSMSSKHGSVVSHIHSCPLEWQTTGGDLTWVSDPVVGNINYSEQETSKIWEAISILAEYLYQYLYILKVHLHFLAINNFAQCGIGQDQIQKHAFSPPLGSEHPHDVRKSKPKDKQGSPLVCVIFGRVFGILHCQQSIQPEGMSSSTLCRIRRRHSYHIGRYY